MDIPSQDTMNQWLTEIDEQITLYENTLSEADFKQDYYAHLATLYAAQGRMQYLGEDNPVFYETSYRQAVYYMEQNYRMVYDSNFPEYIGDTDEANWDWVDENAGLDLLIWTMMGGEFDKLEQLSQLIEIPPCEQISYDEEYDETMHDAGWLLSTMCEFFKRNSKEAMMEARQIVKHYQDVAPKSTHPNRHYYGITKVITGIINRDRLEVEEGISLQLNYHQQFAESQNNKDSICYVCEDAIAMAKLAYHHNIFISIGGFHVKYSP